jgi:hypothetical protein
VNWTASTSGTVNTDVEIEAARGLIFQSIQGGTVDAFPYTLPAGPAPARAFSISSLAPSLTFVDPVGIAGFIGPVMNRNFIAVADFAIPGTIVFLHVGTGAADSYPVYRVTDPALRYATGMDRDPSTGELFVVTHPTGASLEFTGFGVLRFCPRTN